MDLIKYITRYTTIPLGFRDNADLTKQLIKATHNSRDVIERALDEVGCQVNAVQFELEWLGKAVK